MQIDHVTERIQQVDYRKSADSQRIQMRKAVGKTIDEDVKGFGIAQKDVDDVNIGYQIATGGKIHRSTKRKSLIYGCFFLMTPWINADELRVKFGLTTKAALDGIKAANFSLPKTLIRSRSSTYRYAGIRSIMEKFKAPEASITQVMSMYDEIDGHIPDLNNSRPKSIAGSLIFYWIEINRMPFTIHEFARMIDISEITIIKNVKRIREFFQTGLACEA